MPEGDTVYLTARRLASALIGNLLTRGELRHPRLSTMDLAGRSVVGVRSVGKHLFVRFDRDLSLHNHLGMDGSWRLVGTGARAGHQVRVILATSERMALGVNLHQLALVSTAEEHRLVDHLGPDLLDPSWSPEHAAEAVRRLRLDPSREIGLALLDQTLVAGIGNMWKAEVCFLLGVSPWTPVSDVDVPRAVELGRELLLHSISGGRPVLRVYGRQRAGCPRCGGRVVVATQGSDTRERVTYFCPACQPGPQIGLSAGGRANNVRGTRERRWSEGD